MLDKMLAAIGLGEADAHITNLVYWRPPGNRTPTPQETLICKPFLERQIELVKPEFLVLLGGPAASFILGETEGIMKLRGKWREVTVGAHTARAIATLHPVYLLRTPLAKRMAWRDMLAVDAALKGISK
jgi:uracil-DNA glycosylase